MSVEWELAPRRPLALEEARKQGAHAVHDAEEVDLYGEAVVFGGDLVAGAGQAYAGIVDQHVKSGVPFGHGLCEFLDIGHAQQIGLVAIDAPTTRQLGKRFFHILQLRWIASVQQNLMALRDQHPRVRQHAVRLTEPGKVRVFLKLKAGNLLAGLPGRHTNDILDLIGDVYPGMEPARSVMQTSLQNANPIIHPAVTIANAARIESTGGDFLFYEEGVSDATGRLIEALGYDNDDGVVRASFVHYTSPEEVTRLIEALDQLL